MRFRVYLKPFNADGTYSSTWVEISKYCQNLGTLSIDTDSSDFQIGVFRTSNVTLHLNNITGIFSDVDSPASMFLYKRAESLVKITYEFGDDESWCGVSEIEECYLSEEIEVFQGLLNDDTFLEDAKTAFVEFIVFGFESLLDKEQAPFGLLSNGMTFKNALFAALGQTRIVNYVTVDLTNLNPDLNIAIDDVSSFENKTCKEMIDSLLNASNSVMVIQDSILYIKPRDPSAAINYHFYGQAAISGIENILEVNDIGNGMNRTFNFVRWGSTTDSVIDSASYRKYGLKKKEVTYDYITSQSKKLQIMNAVLSEFSLPKKELNLSTPLNYDTLAINILDRISIDYPTIIFPWENTMLPICGVAICGEGVLPIGLWALTIDPSANWKVIKKEIDFDNFNMNFKMRLI